MSASITDYFQPKQTATSTNTKKRKHPDNEDAEEATTDCPESAVSTETTSTSSSSVSEPTRKRMKLNNDAAPETKQESDDEEDDEDEDMVQDTTKPTKPTSSTDKENEPDTVKPGKEAKDITYANCDELLHESWRKVLAAEFEKAYFKQLRKKLDAAQKSKVEIFPPLQHTFRAFEFCPWDQLKVVLLGQDPYHDDGQAEGLCFSVPSGIKVPSSLKNMMKEAKTDVDFVDPGHGSLVKWAEQGVLLLNTVLTVQAHKANSHKDFGWQQFTDAVIKAVSEKHDGVVFILWGGQAKKKKKMINTKKHKVVESAHPSGLSAHRGFFGSKPYSKTNAFLKELGKEEINWQT
eukprot:CAMPEP_0197029908 /NCGR_PEP_ID=MMETSP1384-20130603/9251_1 /TAXON_ID=29189 /ORGANISM="Ammonia sp." /LENGTH=347 /DNA_ID=CAMNT_0042459155 /DNA_START=136 /DNA_END=1179 /DNA_ORIENTATION=-